jgi:hypothetical protein
MNGTAYLVHVRGRTEGESYLLSDAARGEFMGVACIRGIYRPPNKSPSHWMAGRVTYIPLENILLVTEYDSFEAYCDALKRHYHEKIK